MNEDSNPGTPRDKQARGSDSRFLAYMKQQGFEGRDIHNDFVVIEKMPPHKGFIEIGGMIRQGSIAANQRAVAKWVYDVDNYRDFTIEVQLGSLRFTEGKL